MLEAKDGVRAAEAKEKISEAAPFVTTASMGRLAASAAIGGAIRSAIFPGVGIDRFPASLEASGLVKLTRSSQFPKLL